MKTLSKNQILTWQQAYNWAKLDEPKYIMFGNQPNTKQGKEFFKPFLEAKLIESEHLKYAGAFKLTEKGKYKFEEILLSF